MSQSLDMIVMRDLEVGSTSDLSRVTAKVKEVTAQVTYITSNVLTLDSITDLAVGGTGVGLSSGAIFSITSVNLDDSQITVDVTSGVITLTEYVQIDSPYISSSDFALVTVGGAKTDPALLGGNNFATGLSGKVPWAFYGFDGSIVYGTDVEVPTRNTIIITEEVPGTIVYYKLTETPPIPYTITGVFATDVLNFEVVDGISGTRGDRGLQGPIGVGEVYVWRKVTDTDVGIDLTIVSMDGIDADTQLGTIILNMPSSPAVGDRFAIRDYFGTWNTYNVTLLSGASNVMGVNDDFLCTRKWETYEFIYVDATIGWRLL